MSMALTTQQETSYSKMQSLMNSDNFKQAMADALPRHITPDRMARVALTSLRRTPKLLDCKPASIAKAIMEAAQLGLETDGILGQAYLVPYKDECQLIAGYRGLVELCRRSGEISLLKANVVREGDHFLYQEVPPELTHRVDSSPEAPITHVYAWARLRDGAEDFVCWTTAQVNKHRDRFSQGYAMAKKYGKDSPWDSHWEWMAKKTVIRQLCKLLPMSIEAQRVAMREDAIEGGWIDGQTMESRNGKRAYHSALHDALTGPEDNPADDEPPTQEEPPDVVTDDAATGWWEHAGESLAKATTLSGCDGIYHAEEGDAQRYGLADQWSEAVERRKADIRGKRGAASNHPELIDKGSPNE